MKKDDLPTLGFPVTAIWSMIITTSLFTSKVIKDFIRINQTVINSILSKFLGAFIWRNFTYWELDQDQVII